MKQILNNGRGITLIELLISIALISLVLILATSFHLFGQNQVVKQSEQMDYQSSVRLALNHITKDIRNADSVVATGNHTLTLVIDGEEVIYKVEDNILKVNGSDLVSNIQNNWIEEVDGNRVEIKLASLTPRQGENTSHSTVIYLRD
ncbi:PilW family protein [Evansella tamaricis]|uniref:Prepilin-type N-terminal cleavage/methylation domain-containing protein n=1 Tax=Evansella tamaricis TaxID=2069301 RepID=A0ABS6JBI1_9BACI|nr:prepilin-type N-terminal cleavage/methylation domain-containing protein [Evansella tamaricis]MBU9711010.1 prepilin-type N-terminal cleavage/methylation domain-containing protein [Evansella tamaricis]